MIIGSLFLVLLTATNTLTKEKEDETDNFSDFRQFVSDSKKKSTTPRPCTGSEVSCTSYELLKDESKRDVGLTDAELLSRVSVKGKGKILRVSGIGRRTTPHEAREAVEFLLSFSHMNKSVFDPTLKSVWRDFTDPARPPPIIAKFDSAVSRRVAQKMVRGMFNHWRRHLTHPTVTPHPEHPDDGDYDMTNPPDYESIASVVDPTQITVLKPQPLVGKNETISTEVTCWKAMGTILDEILRPVLAPLIAEYCPDRPDVQIHLLIQHRGQYVQNITFP